ncbi:YafY family protein [Stenotrophomonas sp. 24(2023)]|uniref:helix-turn-helix transcriptional regulator n=1 Tax=Stenotrophomonas sp. 24(2023) TaxID=3068324 RepID=UPI0027DF0300|nr:YafY family protein [Stenotrophomonas sp. 24(2023)]WMJ68654.1 YafY family protein [Stenotrophomonas sp. 24(2023)]
MSRSERLLALLQVLRSHRRPVSGQVLAAQTGVSLRTLYRDIASLQAQGADIEGERGVGYQMRPGFLLPPLMFSAEELDALVLGMRWVADRGDAALARGASAVLAKVGAVLPPDLRRDLHESALLVGTGPGRAPPGPALDLLRPAIRERRRLQITYEDAAGGVSRRVVWPFALVYFDQSRVLMCWCEGRNDFRNFRTDRIRQAAPMDGVYPGTRQQLLREWRRRRPDHGQSLLPETDSSG